MDTTHPPGAWQRAGRELERRREQLGYGSRKRPEFVRDRGGASPPSVKTIGRLERGERDAFPASRIAQFERMYAVEPGSIEAVLAGGDLTPLPGAPGGPPAPGSARLAEEPGGQASAPLDLSQFLTGTDELSRTVRGVLQLAKDDGDDQIYRTVHGILALRWDGKPYPDEEYVNVLRSVAGAVRAARGEEAGDGNGGQASA